MAPSKGRGRQKRSFLSQSLGFLKGRSASKKAAKNHFYNELYSHGNMQSFFQTPGKPVWMKREYEKFADEAYIKNVIANRSISLISRGAASVPLKLHKTEGDETIHIKGHALIDLLKRPNPCDSGKEFFESLYAYRLLSGNAYVHGLILNEGEVKELHLLRPDRVTVIASKNCLPSGYQYAVGKDVQNFPVDRITGRSSILHLKSFHPTNDWYGLSPIEAAAYSIDQHNQSAIWNQSLLQNGARPSGAMVVKTGNNGTPEILGDDQYNRLKAQIDDQFSGAANAGRPLLLEGGLDWKEMSLSPKDMDFLESKNSSARDIALAFGVPSQLLGIPGDNTYSNMVEARMALWEQTIIPLVDNVVGALNNWLVPYFGNSLKISYDTDQISALSSRREKVWARIEQASFMTINEKREAVGLDPIEGGDAL